MPLRFFADHCVSNLVIETLRNPGHEVLRLKDHMPVESADWLVISKAQELDAILLSLNGDFADIVAYPPEKFRGIVALQVRDHPEVVPALMRNLMDYLAARPTREYYSGKLLVVESGRIRIRS